MRRVLIFVLLLAVTLGQNSTSSLGIYNTTAPIMSTWFCKKYKCTVDSSQGSGRGGSSLLTYLPEYSTTERHPLKLTVGRDSYGRIAQAEALLPPGTAGRILNYEMEYLADLTRLLLGVEIERKRFVDEYQTFVMGLDGERGLWFMEKGKANTKPPKEYIILCSYVRMGQKTGYSALTEDAIRFIITDEVPEQS